jgi:chromosome segregation protein
VKGQLSAAEVTMVLDNSSVVAGQPSAVMPDFSEITVSRRLYRSGEGEYLINNNPVRLLDVHLFLAQAQFAQHSYSVVGQGTIDKLLTVTPAERKDFFR